MNKKEVPPRPLLSDLGIWKGEPLGELRDALFTTYDPPEPDFLVNEFFPSLFRGRLSQTDDNRSLVALRNLLKEIKPVIVSSSGTGRELARHAWLWGCTEPLTVGMRRSAVQHSKLWLLKWDRNGLRRLEVVISSCNLTSSSLSDQSQGVWRCVVPLENAGVGAGGWSPLPEFLDKLADSCTVENNIRRFKQLFDSARCPEGVTFVASVPGSHANDKWGWNALRALCPPNSRVKVQAPHIGTWTCAELKALRMPGTLAWICHEKWRDHWSLPGATLEAIQNRDSTWSILQLQRSDEPPWLHAKLYGLQSSNWHRLLITSANFSPSAWGPKHIRNFELGVLVHERFPFLLAPLPAGSQWTISDVDTKFASSGWADSSWDGERLQVLCRAESRIQRLQLMYSGEQAWKPLLASWKNKDGLKFTERPLTPKAGIPIGAAITLVNKDRLEAPVRDLRPDSGQEALDMPGLTKEEVAKINVELLLERYGGRPLPSGNSRVNGISSHTKNGTLDYSVEAFVAARQGFALLDCWRRKFDEKRIDQRVCENLRNDGVALRNYYAAGYKKDPADPGCWVAFALIKEGFDLQLHGRVIEEKTP